MIASRQHHIIIVQSSTASMLTHFFQRKNRPTSTTLTLLSFPNAVTLFPGQKEKMAKHSKATSSKRNTKTSSQCLTNTSGRKVRHEDNYLEHIDAYCNYEIFYVTSRRLSSVQIMFQHHSQLHCHYQYLQ